MRDNKELRRAIGQTAAKIFIANLKAVNRQPFKSIFAMNKLISIRLYRNDP